MKVPVAPRYTVKAAACPLLLGDRTSCAPPGFDTVYIARQDTRAQTRFILYHELGHLFDFQVANHRLRQRFRRLVHRQGPWAGELPELFADAYATCAFPWRVERNEWLWEGRIESDGYYGYSAKWLPHRRFCRALRSQLLPRKVAGP